MASLLRFLSCAALAWLALLALGTAATSPAMAAAAGRCADTTIRPRGENLDRAREATLCLLNAERAKNDLAPLRANKHLGRAANAYSARMVRERFFAHVCPEGSTLESRIRKGTKYLASASDWALGENIAWGSGSLSSPRSIVRGWMRSAPHRRAILNGRFRDVGIGVAPGAPTSVAGAAATYTTEFGYRVVD